MLSPVSTLPSCWTRVKACLSNERTIANAKIAFWTSVSVGSNWIPVPFLTGAVTQATLFMAIQEMLKHPDSALLQNSETFRQVVATRNWKRLSLGAAISAAGGVLGDLALASKVHALFLLPNLASLALGLKVTYLPTQSVEDTHAQVTDPLISLDQEQPLSTQH